jgi:hypothetical protein
MPSRTIKGAGFSPDLLIFLRLLSRHRVRYLVVGGEAVIFHGYPRVTGDVDFFYENTPANTKRLFAVLLEFWDGRIPGIASPEELRELGIIIQFGRPPPHRIDLMNRIDGVRFSEAWRTRVLVGLATRSGRVPARYIDLRLLLKNKRATGRPRDLEDVRFLEPKAKRTRSRHPKAREGR